jgi:putative alpha-1,2-mannosidase
MGNGKAFTIKANGNSDENLYIQNAFLNGAPLNQPWFSHAAIADGGTLVLNMGPAPNRKWGSAAESAPPSMSERS